MWTPLSPTLRGELEQFRLAFCCEECEHFVEPNGPCDLLYPIEPHRRAAVEKAADGDPLLFCKMFEAR